MAATVLATLIAIPVFKDGYPDLRVGEWLQVAVSETGESRQPARTPAPA